MLVSCFKEQIVLTSLHCVWTHIICVDVKWYVIYDVKRKLYNLILAVFMYMQPDQLPAIIQ